MRISFCPRCHPTQRMIATQESTVEPFGNQVLYTVKHIRECGACGIIIETTVPTLVPRVRVLK